MSGYRKVDYVKKPMIDRDSSTTVCYDLSMTQMLKYLKQNGNISMLNLGKVKQSHMIFLHDIDVGDMRNNRRLQSSLG